MNKAQREFLSSLKPMALLEFRNELMKEFNLTERKAMLSIVKWLRLKNK
jgi:hypothetical protein